MSLSEESNTGLARMPLVRYGTAVLAVLLALAGRWLLWPVLEEQAPLLLFTLAVTFSAWYGGLGPGLFATALSALVGDYFFIEPYYSFVIKDSTETVRLGLFLLIGSSISLLSEALISAVRRAERSALETRRHQESLRQSEELRGSMIEEMKDYAIVMTDTAGRVTGWNKGAERVFGYQEAELLGETAARLFTPEDIRDGVPERELSTAAQHGRAEDERWHVRKDGTRFWASGVTSAARDVDGQLRGFTKVARDLTERKRAEEERRATEARYRVVAETASDAIITIDEESTILFANRSVEKIFGHTLAEVIGGNLTMLMPDYLRHLHRAGISRYVETGQKHVSWEALEVLGLHKSGREIPLEVSFGEYTENNRRIFSGIIRDVTDRKRAEESLKMQSRVLENMVEGVSLADETGVIIYTNPAEDEMFGYERGELIGQHVTVQNTYPPEENARIVGEVIKQLMTKGAWSGEFSNRKKDGTPFTTFARITALEISGRKHWVCVQEDITERKSAEEARRQSEERYRAFIRQSSEGIWRFELEQPVSVERPEDEQIEHYYQFGYLAECNDAMARMYGYSSAEEVTGARLGDLLVRSDPRNIEYLRSFIRSGYQLSDAESLETDKSGNQKWFSNNLVGIVEDGFVLRAWGTQRDITERKQAEEALQVSRQRFDLAIESTELGVWYCDLPFDKLIWNDKCKEHFGLPADAEVTIELFYECLHEDDRERTRQTIKRSIEGNSGYDIDYRTVTPYGRTRWIRAIGRAFYDSAGNPYRFDGVTVDITERKRAEEEREQLLAREQAAREEVEKANQLKDEFLATLSHELRTPLTAILGWSRMLSAGSLNEADAKRATGIIQRNASAQNQLIDDLLDTSRIITGKLRLDVRPVELAPVIEAAVDAVRPAAEAKNIRLQTVLDPRAGPISGDPDRLQQVVWNLLSNAIKFTPKHGRVQVRLERVNSHIEIAVSDTGQGIAPEVLPHVFERFRQADSSSTRRHGGLGLGLAIVSQLVELHGGTVHAESPGEGRGATFTMKIPLLIVHRETSEAERRHPAARSNSALDCPPALDGLRVLVVDDETDSRELVVAVLMQCGADVVAVASASEALEEITRRQFDVLVSDIGMPGTDGYELIEEVRRLPAERGGKIPAAALTAYASVGDRMRVLSAGYQIHVPKPVEPAELATVVASLAKRNTKV